MPVDWATFIASVVASVAGSGLLAWWLDRQRFRHQQAMDVWDRIQQGYEREIEALDKAGEGQKANQKRLEYANQLSAWRDQQKLNAVAPRQVRSEGGTSLTEGEVQELRRLLEASGNLNPGALSAEDHFLRGNSHYFSGQYEEALANYNRSLQLRPDHLHTITNRGQTLLHLGRRREALADANRALELRPDDPVTLTNRGVALGSLMRYEEALADFNRALVLRPDDPQILTNLGGALHILSRHDEALAVYNRALVLRPDDPNTLYNVACLFALTERYPEALDWLARAITADAKYRSMAVEDPDFAPLRDHPQLGPQFRQLVG